MKIIIIEGTSTAGKTTLANMVTDVLRRTGKKALLIDEDQTLMPVLRCAKAQKHVKHINKIIRSFAKTDFDFIIIDRFHLTCAAVCNMDLADFTKIEENLLENDPIIIFLKIDEDKLGNRILEAMKHRNSSWTQHVASKGGEKEIETWYLETQKKLFKRLKDSKIKCIKYNSTGSRYKEITKRIILDLK